MDDTNIDSLPTILVMLGATGDLATKKLIPALWKLYTGDKLPDLFQVVGFSRQELSNEDWQARVVDIVSQRENSADPDQVASFSKRFVYEPGNFQDSEAYDRLATRLGRQDDAWNLCANKLFYLAVPPPYYETIFENLSDSGLTEPCSPEEGWTRVIVEKPFGKDLQTAQALDEKLGKLFREEQIYRIDHYLGKETARNILAFRFSNTFLGPAWDNQSIDSVHVHFPEGSGVNGRGEFYDGIGALRDVGQNHMLQLLALFLMDNPGEYTAEAIRRERTRILEALETMDEKDVSEKTMRGQYRGYTDVEGVAEDSQTETYFRIETELNLPRWQGVPIYIESGKNLSDSKFEIIVQFRHKSPCLCPPGNHYTNELRYRVQPDEGVYMTFWVKKPGIDTVIEQKDFSFDYHQAFDTDGFIDAYEKLLLDAVMGDQTLFVSTDEIVASWKFIDPIVRAWQENIAPLVTYEPGATRRDVADLQEEVIKPPKKEIGYIGLGKMGRNMVERLVDRKWNVVATDPDETARAATKEYGANVESSAAAVVSSLSAPRLVWLMVPHQVVDDVLDEISDVLEEGDIVIDGGNSKYTESVRRAKELSSKGIRFADIGVSGGPRGARYGACLMIGGERELYRELVGLLGDLSAPGGYGYMGSSGAGHFVKMVHNGIEYGMMQAIGEGFEMLKNTDEFELDVERISNVYNHASVIESRLVGWLKDAYEEYGEGLTDISGEVSHSGEGQWTVEAAKKLGIPLPVIEGALQFRIDSQGNPSYTGQVVSALRNQFGGHKVDKE